MSSCTLASKAWILCSESAIKQGLCFTAVEGDGGDERLVELELACTADGAAPSDSV